ncbi:sulfoxide reductase heme-binding subunit YedZ [Inhella sp. 4Y17]|uniref:Protein-methionine-sulfoxide reductase heme-binding subunit MsrQ n=2 Tax=Inhella gelatinilytica TaxID=2795030 RepID=A0A931ITJ0_9BURK|nr:sulfoxide reductase heme-binding subunit YedZ [Inhella gelatinilytica]
MWLVTAAFTHRLGANPAEALIRGLGDWTIRGLVLTLAITPLRVQFHQPALLRFRRLLGVWTFVYATLHLLAYAWLDMGLDLLDIVGDIAKRPFILVGMLSFGLLLPLAATSFNAAVRRLGGKRWQTLHRVVYLIPFAACLHFWWMRAGKQNFADPFFYSALFALALGWRVWRRFKKRPG